MNKYWNAFKSLNAKSEFDSAVKDARAAQLRIAELTRELELVRIDLEKALERSEAAKREMASLEAA